MDLQQTFETANHEILLEKLSLYGEGKAALSLLCDYLSDRKHGVKIDDRFSSILDAPVGVSQGSVLGPSLFLIYMNDSAVCFKKFFINMFGDYTLISISESNILKTVNILNSELKSFFVWLCVNCLKPDINKTECKLISNQY